MHNCNWTDTRLIVAIVNNNYLILRHIPKVQQKLNCLFVFSPNYSIGQSIGDSRCYLDGGGSAESLTASEDLSVGSAIGKCIPPIHLGRFFSVFGLMLQCNDLHSLLFCLFLDAAVAVNVAVDDVIIYAIRSAGTLTINGNPRLDNSGNISLSIRERDAPVSIAPGTKNLVLNVALDREGKTGPASVYINVICIRRDTYDPVSQMRRILCCAI